MNNSIVAGLAVGAWMFASPAMAADVADPAYDWSGAYVGLDAGYVWANSDVSFIVKGKTLSSSLEPSGFFGSLHAGYNMETDSNLVFGFEGDVDFPMPSDATAAFGVDMNWAGSARARVGFAMDRLMPYATGGIALASVDYSFTTLDSSNLLVGWTVGAGLEYAITDNMTLRTEYRYTDYGDASGTTRLGASAIDLTSSDVRVGVSWKF